MTTALIPATDGLVGSTTPRLWTPPLVAGPPGPCGCGCALTPETSEGFEAVEFAAEVGHPFLPWQRLAVIHGLERLPDGRPRFRILVLIVARQCGKTSIPKVLCAWWQFRKKVPMILGTSTQTAYAMETWTATRLLVEQVRAFDALHAPGRRWYRTTNGQTESWTVDGCRYKIAAANAEGGRSLTVHRGVADELRQHHSYEAWNAMEPACSPPDAQIWALSNAGSDRSVVLNDLRASALEFIGSGVGDPRLGLLEWSAPEGADPEDVDALLQANPRVGYGYSLGDLLAKGARAKRLGGEALAGFQTENMCIRVRVLDPAVDAGSWAACRDPGALDGVRGRLAVCLDVSRDERHATLAAAGVLPDGRVRVETVAEWDGSGLSAALARDLPRWVGRLRPRAFGYFPNGPAAALEAGLADRRKQGVAGWPPRGTTVEPIRGETAAVCMGFAEAVRAGLVAHSGQGLLDAHVGGAVRRQVGGTWVFDRPDDAPCDAAWAAAGAAFLARTLPARQVSRTTAFAG